MTTLDKLRWQHIQAAQGINALPRSIIGLEYMVIYDFTFLLVYLFCISPCKKLNLYGSGSLFSTQIRIAPNRNVHSCQELQEQ